MRSLFVSQEMPPETGWGGVGTYVDIITSTLAAMGHEPHVLSVVPGQAASRIERDGVTIHREPLPAVRGSRRVGPETWRRLWLPLTAARLIDRLEFVPDVVECPEWCAEGLVLGLRGRLPLVVRMHSGARQLFQYTLQGQHWFGVDGRIAKRLEELSVRRANAVSATQSVLDEVSGPLRLDPAALHPMSYPLRLGPTLPPSEGNRVTFLGRFEQRKGPEVVLAAIPQVLAAVPDATFAFVGKDATPSGALSSAGWLRAEAERLGVAHAVEVREAFGRPVVEEALGRTTISVVPSRWESFGYTVAEAMAAGRPVVVSDIAAFRELVEDGVTGRVARPDDPADWADKLVSLLTDETRAQAIAAAALQRLRHLTDPTRIAELTLAAHEAAIERVAQHKRAATSLWW
ncbi:MAG: glycosyltransferase family 4 protein [Mycobacteriales bacterium]